VKEERLKKPTEAGESLHVVTAPAWCQQAILKKAVRLGLEVVVTEPSVLTTTIKIRSRKEMSSVEDALKLLAGALEAAAELGLNEVEVQRLCVMATYAPTS
jgi:hypothetical protein